MLVVCSTMCISFHGADCQVLYSLYPSSRVALDPCLSKSGIVFVDSELCIVYKILQIIVLL